MYQLQPLDLLRQARIRYSQSEIAVLLNVDVRTAHRWEVRENEPPLYQATVNIHCPKNYELTFRLIRKSTVRQVMVSALV